MLDMHIGRCTGVLFQTLLCWTLIEHCSAGHRPYERWERPRYPRQNDRWTQRIEYPSVNDEGTQGLRYPSVHGRGQEIRYPSLSDSDASAQIKKCFPGYYRDGSGPFLGRCVSCQCNGLADECEDETGRCLNCKYNTAGDRCERCKEGYYGNAAQKTCRVCPCPLSVPTNSFAIGCREVFDGFQCICRAGYTGDKCQSCAPGYFGDPLTVGGKCQPCNCNGNGNSCDPKTGVCKNALEPGDTNTDNQCQECDSCAQTLLHDLEKLDDELERVKAQLGNVTASASSQDRLKKLEKAVADTKVLVKKFGTFINNQEDKVNQLDEDTQSLSDDISALRNKAEKEAADVDKAVSDVGKTHKRAKQLDSEIQKTLKKIQDLLDHLKDAGTTGGVVPSENLVKMLADAERMVKEMENRNFTPQKSATVKEREEAKKLLDYIKTNVSKQFDENNATAERIRDLLKGYEAKLKDLDQALKEAKDLVKKANAQNGLNAQAMVDMQKRIENLNAEQKTVKDQMAMADDELQKTEDLVKMLADSKTEYERLAAQLDGAKTELTKKVNEISKAAAKENIVEAAEAHAKTLNRLAKELEDSVKNASGRPEVRNAKDAIDAYKNITDAINAAELAANETKNAADKALEGIKNQQLPERTKYLKDTSENLIRNAQEANRNLKSAAGELNNLKKRLNNAEKKKNALQKDLLDVQKELGGINRDDVVDMIEDAKKKAASANGTASDTMDKLNDIKKEIEKINVTPASSNLSNLLNNVDQSVKNLLKTIPSLSDKLTEVENLTSQFSPVSNITENIKKIKELIELARDAANRVTVPMKFSGSGHVELRPPQNVDDLKAYTSMILSLQRPKDRGDGKRRRRQAKENADMFVLYLGNRDTTKNYFGMVLRNNVLYGVYKLNGQEYEMQTGSITKSDPEPATFDKVELHRIYQDAKLVLTNDISSNEPGVPIESSMQGEVDKNLLDLSPSDIVFYVGGYPANFTPPKSLDLPMYKGCIEFSSFNDKVISLYNFLNAEKINLQTPCKRYVSPVDSDYYEGTGYSKVDIDKKNTFLFISMSVYSRSENGLLLYIGTEDNYFTVTTEQGVIFLRSNLLENPVYNSNTKSFPTDDWVEIQVISTNQGKMTVRISSKDVAVAQAAYRNDHFKEFYVGGAPRELRERHNITMQPFKGCLKNLKLNKATKLVAEQVGVSKGCPRASLVSRKAEFKRQSALSSDLKGFSLDNDVVSLGFKTKQSRGLILRNKLLDNGINIALENGHVILNSNDKSWKSNKQYNDDRWHYLTVTRRTGRTELLVDDDDQGQEQSGSSIPDTGGVLILGNNDFQGCMSNLYTRRPNSLHKAEDFSSFQASGAVLLDVCTADSLAQLMLDRNSKKR